MVALDRVHCKGMDFFKPSETIHAEIHLLSCSSWEILRKEGVGRVET